MIQYSFKHIQQLEISHDFDGVGDEILEKILSFHTLLSVADKKEQKKKILSISLDAYSIG